MMALADPVRQENHSGIFWARVEGAMPSYRSPRKWLKDHGPALIRRYHSQPA